MISAVRPSIYPSWQQFKSLNLLSAVRPGDPPLFDTFPSSSYPFFKCQDAACWGGGGAGGSRSFSSSLPILISGLLVVLLTLQGRVSIGLFECSLPSFNHFIGSH